MVLAAGSTAHADVQWDKGLVTANGIGIADRHAPSPASAREPARRAAEDAARAKLAAQIPSLPLATKQTVKARLSEAKIKARIDRAVAAAIVIDSTPQTDGSWTVTMAVPIEAVRQAISGTRALDLKAGAKDDHADPPVVVVTDVPLKPSIVWAVGSSDAATIWVDSEAALPAWAKAAPRAKAVGVKGGTIGLESTGAVGGPSTLFVLVPKK
ncbi:MAG TPA: hypothetical protein VFQ53_23880 [Kofleriaceae bacterium]|nr:hypothetical protein [Kofleriaceae bacterium]